MVLTDINAYIKPVVGVVPTASAAATINGASIDRINYQSAVLVANTGAETGSPSARSLNAKIQHSTDGSTGWNDYTDPTTGAVAAITAITAASTQAKVAVNLSAAKRYIRVVETVAFTGGTSPTLAVSGHVILGGALVTPAV